MQQQDRIMDGDLQTLGLQSILKMLALSEKSGTLFVHSGPETLSIGLRKGRIVSLREEGGVPHPDLLTLLRLVDKLDLAREQAVRHHSGGNIQDALATLVAQNVMSAAEMQRRLECAVSQSISHALRWVDGQFAFYRHVVTMESKMQPLDIDAVLLEALRQADEWEELGESSLSRSSIARWLPEVSNDVRTLGLNQESIEVLCLANGELPLQAIALVHMLPEARVARILSRLIDLRLVEIVDIALEKALQHDLTNLIIKCQTSLARLKQDDSPEQHLLGLLTIFNEGLNGLLVHHSKYSKFARSLRGRGNIPFPDIANYLERRFFSQLQLLASQHYPILDTIEFTDGKLDCTNILTLNKVVKGAKLEEFYWEAVLGLSAFLRLLFADLLRDEMGNSQTGHSLNSIWKSLLTEIDNEIQQYQYKRAYRTTQSAHGRSSTQSVRWGHAQRWNAFRERDAGSGPASYFPPDSQRGSFS